jgi:hypothetical protein
MENKDSEKKRELEIYNLFRSEQTAMLTGYDGKINKYWLTDEEKSKLPADGDVNINLLVEQRWDLLKSLPEEFDGFIQYWETSKILEHELGPSGIRDD